VSKGRARANSSKDSPLKIVRIVVVIALVAALTASPAAASTLPYVPIDHWLTPYVTDAIGRGLLPGLTLAEQPYAREAIAKALRAEHAAAATKPPAYTPYKVWLLDRIRAEIDPTVPSPRAALSKTTDAPTLGYGLEVRAELETGDDARRYGADALKGILLPYAGFTSGRGLAGGLRFRLDTDGAQIPNFNGREWRNGLTGDARQAYLLLQFGAVDVVLGRDDLRWGASERSSLLLSAYAPAFDQLGLRFKIGPITASSFAGSLDDMTLDQPTAEAPGDTLPAGTVVRRHVSGHRVEWRVSDAVTVGIAEAIVYGGEDRGLEAQYVIPVNIYYAAQWNSGINDNALFGATLEVRPGRDAQLYGELLVDDAQIDSNTPADEEPFQGGLLVGGRLYDPLGLEGAALRAEFAKVWPYTYNQVLPWNRYLYHDQPIGFDLGSDAQAIRAQFTRWAGPNFTWSLDGRYEERGATRIDDPWPVPVSGPDSLTPFPKHDTIPTGTVERRRRLSGEVWFHPRPGCDFRLGGGWVDVKNLDNAPGARREEWFVQGSVALNWSRWFEGEKAEGP
jgi:hypothetical protein